jgi:hypothetical protein
MNHINKQKLLQLITEIAPGRGAAEHESNDNDKFLKNFLPIPDYRFALEPNILLILGGHGVGKTELFRLLAIASGREALVQSLGIRSLPNLNKTSWINGFGHTGQGDKKLPASDVIDKQMSQANKIEWRSFWVGLIFGRLLQQEDFKLKEFLVEQIGDEIAKILRDELPRLSVWQPIIYRDFESLNIVLDKLDEKLIETDDWLFITYDELDRLVPTYNDLPDPIRELLAFWLDRWRRWKRIRPKIFLRTDLFRDDFLSFPDASKLKAHQVTLEWKHSWLYRLLVKRLANSGLEMTEYIQNIPNLIIKDDADLGWTVSSDEKLFEELIEIMIGKYMGSGAKKGITYRWIPNHLQDAGGRIAPRSFLKLFVLAAERRIEHLEPFDESMCLLQPSDLQGALMDTSEDRIRELKAEFSLLKRLENSLIGLEAPIQKDVFLEVLKTSESIGQQLPSASPEEILQYLLQLGVIEISRSDGRINMPEIYLHGFGVKRKGGVKRPH